MVIPRSRSSGALSIESNARNDTFGLFFDSTLVIAAVNVVFPWSMCPIVPTLTCGLTLSNFSFAISLHPRIQTSRQRRAKSLHFPVVSSNASCPQKNAYYGAGDGARTRDHLLGRQRL